MKGSVQSLISRRFVSQGKIRALARMFLGSIPCWVKLSRCRCERDPLAAGSRWVVCFLRGYPSQDQDTWPPAGGPTDG